MAFTSNLGSSPIIDDSNADRYVQQILDPSQPFAGGWTARDYSRDGMTTSYSGPRYPRSDWPDLIKDLEEREATLTHLHKRAGVRVMNQKSLPYCWMYGTVGAMQMAYARQSFIVPELSATSAAAKGKNYQKQGGWAKEALGYIEKYGVGTLEYWPEAELDRRHDSPELRGNASLHKVTPGTGFEELASQSFDELVCSLIDGRPTTMGLNWWGHLVFGLRAVVIERGSFGVEIMNSWGTNWENVGKSVLRESKATPQEAVSIISVTPLRNAA